MISWKNVVDGDHYEWMMWFSSVAEGFYLKILLTLWKFSASCLRWFTGKNYRVFRLLYKETCSCWNCTYQRVWERTVLDVRSWPWPLSSCIREHLERTVIHSAVRLARATVAEKSYFHSLINSLNIMATRLFVPLSRCIGKSSVTLIKCYMRAY